MSRNINKRHDLERLGNTSVILSTTEHYEVFQKAGAFFTMAGSGNPWTVGEVEARGPFVVLYEPLTTADFERELLFQDAANEAARRWPDYGQSAHNPFDPDATGRNAFVLGASWMFRRLDRIGARS